jgi:PAS domain S-box-containing protein
MRESFKNNDTYRSLIDNISEGVLALDPEWQIVYANQRAEKLLNRDHGTLSEKNLWKEFPESVDSRFYHAYHEAIQSQTKMVVEDYSKTLGKWTRATVYPFPKGLIIYFQDVTSEKKKERAEESKANYRLFLDRITDGFIVLDKDFRYIYVNHRIGELTHRDPQSLIGKNVWEEFPDAVNSLTYKAFQTAFKEQRFISNIDYFEPLNLWQENYIYPSPEGLSIFIKDISDRKKLEKELGEKEKDRQFELMVTALEAQEKERTHIGRELHDNVNQLIVATKLMLSILRDDPKRMSETMMNRCIDNLEKAIQENRKISHELVTPDLKEETLVEQLRQLLQTMFASNNIKVVISVSGFNEKVLDEPRKLAVYRIAQEQCTNIIKYAKAKKVTLSLFNDDQDFKMIVADDGIGMGKTKIAAGIGLRNIGARAGLFGGEVQVRTKPRRGFELQVILPMSTAVYSHSYDI